MTYAETPGTGVYAVALTPKGCEYVFADGVLTITKIMVDKATVEIEVNCEGREVFLKLFTLTRLYGGSDAVYMDLTNENATVTCNAEGVVTGSIPGSTAKVYVGTTLDGAWSFSGSFSGCTGSVNASTGAITVTGLTADSGSVTVTATKRGYASLTAVYSLSKAYPGPNGEPAVVYSVRPSADVIVKDKTGTFIPASISCEKLKQIGNSAPYVTTEKTLKYQLSDGSLTDYTGAVSVGSATWIEFTLYEGSTVLDRDRVPVIADGKDGIDANLLDWIEEWNGNKTDVGKELIISPRMVAGKKESNGKFTGVMFGRDMIEVDGVMQTGLFGLKNSNLTFSIDAQTGDAFFGGTVLVRKDAKNYVTMNYKDVDDWGLKGVIDGNEDKPVFQLGSVNKIGNFNITRSCIGKSTDTDNPTTGMSLYEEFIKFKEANRLSMIGSNVYPLSTGLKGVARFINKDYNRTLTNYGVEIDVSGANENIAIDILNGDVKLGNGVVKGGRYVLKYTSSLSGYQIGNDDEYIVCTNSSKIDLKLPTAPKEGKAIWVKQLGSGMVGIIPQGNHKMYYRGSNYNWGLINDKSGGVTVLAMITFIGYVNGAYCWVMNTMDVAGVKFGND